MNFSCRGYELTKIDCIQKIRINLKGVIKDTRVKNYKTFKPFKKKLLISKVFFIKMPGINHKGVNSEGMPYKYPK